MFRFENKSSSWVKIKMKIKGPAYFRQQYPGPRSFSLNFSPRERKRISMNIVARDSIVLRDTLQAISFTGKEKQIHLKNCCKRYSQRPFRDSLSDTEKKSSRKTYGIRV